MDELMSKQTAINALKAIKIRLWEIDIPHPGNCPEYIEHHKQIQEMMGFVGNWIERIKTLPVAEPKRGRWDVRYDEEYAEDGIVICSECGEIYANEGFYWYKAHFCPNCGARMEE